MLTSFIRSIIIYIFLVLVMRIMGKKQLGELQPFEFVITLVASELACIPLSDMQAPIIYGIIPIITLLVLNLIMTKAVKHSIKLRQIINGKPVIVINKGSIDSKALSHLDMTIHDLLEGIRSQGYLSPQDLEFAIVENNGNISCIPKGINRPATALDVNADTSNPTMPYSIICEGKFMSNNLNKLNLDRVYIEKILNNNNLKQKDVLLLSIDNTNYYLQPIKGNFIQNKLGENL